MHAKPKAALALLLLVPAPSLGAAAAMLWWPGTTLGAAIFGGLFARGLSRRGNLVALVCQISLDLAWLPESCPR